MVKSYCFPGCLGRNIFQHSYNLCFFENQGFDGFWPNNHVPLQQIVINNPWEFGCHQPNLGHVTDQNSCFFFFSWGFASEGRLPRFQAAGEKPGTPLWPKQMTDFSGVLQEGHLNLLNQWYGSTNFEWEIDYPGSGFRDLGNMCSRCHATLDSFWKTSVQHNTMCRGGCWRMPKMYYCCKDSRI